MRRMTPPTAPAQATAALRNLGTASAPSDSTPEITDAERTALTVTAYDLQLHLQPAVAALSGVARLTVRNDGVQPLPKLPLQLSSTLEWQAASGRIGQGAAQRIPIAQHRIDTDTDHTGAANEAILQLPQPLAPGSSIDLVLAYAGTVERSADRRTRAGQSIDAASEADWDGISAGEVALRGFGHVLWYPVAAAQVFLEDGAQLDIAEGEQRRRESAATVRLRLEIEGGAPAAGFFCGKAEPFTAVTDGMARGGEGDTASVQSLSTAEWPATRLGFGSPSLFVSDHPPESDGGPVGVVDASAAAVQAVQTAARAALPLVKLWIADTPERAPVLFNHSGEPFAQRALLVESAREAAASFAMTHLESHAWFASPEVWLDEGVAQFLPLLALEQAAGRPAVLAQLRDLQPALSLADSPTAQPASGSPSADKTQPVDGRQPAATSAGQPLNTASREVFFRNKSVSVLWMLRTLAGDPALQAAFHTLRQRPDAERTSAAFEQALEAACGKDLHWFFRDWIFEDRGLPDLSIVNAAARPFSGMAGRPDGNLVAVEVRNDGHAAAEVPVTVRSGNLTATERLLVPAMGTASTRILFQGVPNLVEVNDGTVPEVGSSTHQQSLAVPSSSSTAP